MPVELLEEIVFPETMSHSGLKVVDVFFINHNASEPNTVQINTLSQI